MRRPGLPRRLFPLLCCALTFLASDLTAQTSVGIEIEVNLDTSLLTSTGGVSAEFTFDVESPTDRPLAVRLELFSDTGRFVRRDHSPPSKTSSWKAGSKQTYAIPITFATYPELVDEPGNVIAYVGFVDPRGRKVVPPSGSRRNRDGLCFAGAFDFPAKLGTIDDEAVAAAVTAADDAARAGKHTEAWDRLEFVFRNTPDYNHKATLRDALIKIAKHAPPEMTFEEKGIVAQRIREERARYLRQVSGRMFDRGQLHGALALLEEVGGELAEAADAAVMGALNDADRTQKSIDDIRDKILAPSADDKKQIQDLREEFGETEKLLERALTLAKRPAGHKVARELLRRLSHSSEPQIGPPAKAAKEQLEKTLLSSYPDDERAAAEAALNHTCWDRTTTSISHRFVFIGPKSLVNGIPKKSRLSFDLAYLYLTDLFGRVPNPGGDRVTVYFKELWEFGGGVGGGKIINIGRADPSAKKTRVDTSLLYHELTHCVDDTKPIYRGFREGLADLGAAFVQHELGNRAGARAAFGLAQRAFQADYLDRDLEYWRIPNYAPSAGFLLHFIKSYGSVKGGGYEWQRYRQFFRNYRDCPVQDARTPNIARAFAHHLVEAFGAAAFDDLIRFRWPLLPSDREAVAREFAAAKTGDRSQASGFEGYEGSPVPRDRTAWTTASRPKEDAVREDFGMVFDWRVIGPFRKDGVDPDTHAFPPEYEIDFEARYPVFNNNAIWRQPKPRPPVSQDASGWLKFDYPYMDNTAIYSLTHATFEEETDAWLHLRADDDLTVFVNDHLIGKYAFPRESGFGPWRDRGADKMPDAIRFAVRLNKGRNKILIKVRNGRGGSGLSMAIAKRNGTPLENEFKTDDDPAKTQSAKLGDSGSKTWKRALSLKFRNSASARKLDTTVGKFKVQQKTLRGVDTDRGVAWRKYTVRPGFPKDSPSNLAWLPEKATKDVYDFRLEIGLQARRDAPKMCVLFHGDGGRDGLPGHTLILQPRGKNVQARLERYDRLVYQSDRVPFETVKDKPTKLVVEMFSNRLTVRLGEQVLFDQVPVRIIPDRRRIGLALWGPDTYVTDLELRAPRRTK